MGEKQEGWELIVRNVNGFGHARMIIHDLVRAGIVRCLSPHREDLCDNPATSVLWQDQAEWYPCCDQHADYGEQWTGSTHWNPSAFAILVIPDKCREWLKALKPEDRKQYKVRKYEREA